MNLRRGKGFAPVFAFSAIRDESQKVSKYKVLLDRLPRVNKATLQALINHLYW